MVAYNFKKQFADRIKDGSKRHTIRRNGKRKHAERGLNLQLYTGMRTKSCQKICEDKVCLAVFPVQIYVGKESIHWIAVNGRLIPSDQLDRFAVEDGFDGIGQFFEFLNREHGQGLFREASLICWGQSLALDYGTRQQCVSKNQKANTP